MNELTHHKCRICQENFPLSGALLVHKLCNHSPKSIAQLLNDLIINETFQATDEEYDYFFEFTTSFRRSVRANVMDESIDERYETIPDLVAVKMETLDSSDDELAEPFETTDPLFASADTLSVRNRDTSSYAKRMRLNHQEDDEEFQSTGAQSAETEVDSDELAGNSEELPFEFTPGARKGSILLYSISEKQLYRLKNDYIHCKRYVCTVKTCRATLYLRGDHLSKARKFKGHYHCIQEPGSTRRRRNVKSRQPRLLTAKAEVVSGEPTSIDSKNAESLPFEFTPGARMGSTLLYSTNEKQLYRLKNVFTNYKRYVCTVKTCRATLVLKGDHLSKAPQFKDHNHADQELVAARNKFEASFKAKCMDNSADPNILFTTMLNEDPVGGRNSSYDKMKSHLNHRKRAVIKNATPSADCKPQHILGNSRDSTPDEFQSTIEANPKSDDDKLTRRSHLRKKNNAEHLPFEFTPGARFGSILLYSISEKHLYRLKNVFTNYKRYVCTVKTCRATLFLRGDVLSKAPQFKEHNHTDQESVVAKNKFQASCRAKCLEDGIDPSVVFTMMLNEDPVGGSNSSFDKMKRHLSRLKTVSTKAPPTFDSRDPLLMAGNREYSFEDTVSVGSSYTPAEVCQAINYVTPPAADVGQYGYNVGPTMEVDRTLTQEFHPLLGHQPIFDQNSYY